MSKSFDFVIPLEKRTQFEEFIYLKQLKALKKDGYTLINMWDIPGIYEEYDIDPLIEAYEIKCKNYP